MKATLPSLHLFKYDLDEGIVPKKCLCNADVIFLLVIKKCRVGKPSGASEMRAIGGGGGWWPRCKLGS
jgi:hypothetical protein